MVLRPRGLTCQFHTICNLSCQSFTKLNDDALQIVEQILPYFQPAYNLSIELVDQIKEKRDVPIVLEGITLQDDYEGDFSTRRVLYYTLRFTAKTYLFGPTKSASKDIIKRSTVSYLTGTDTTNTRREVTYSATARALKSYTDNVVTTLAADISATAKTFEVADASGIKADKYIFIGDEELFVRSKTGNKITVDRGRDNTKAEKHVAGAEVKGIDYTEAAPAPTFGPIGADSALIEEGDNFGFDGGFLMSSKFGDLNDTFNVADDVVETEIVKKSPDKCKTNI